MFDSLFRAVPMTGRGYLLLEDVHRSGGGSPWQLRLEGTANSRVDDSPSWQMTLGPIGNGIRHLALRGKQQGQECHNLESSVEYAAASVSDLDGLLATPPSSATSSNTIGTSGVAKLSRCPMTLCRSLMIDGVIWDHPELEDYPKTLPRERRPGRRKLLFFISSYT